MLSFQARTLTCGDWDALSGLAGLRELRINGWRLGQAAQGFLEPAEGEEEEVAAEEEGLEAEAEAGGGGQGGGGLRCRGAVPGRLCLPGLELLMIAVRSAGQLVQAVGWLPGLKVAHVSIWAAEGAGAGGGGGGEVREGGGAAAGCGDGAGVSGPAGEPGVQGGRIGEREAGEEGGGVGDAAEARGPAAVLRLWRPLMRCGQLQEVNVSCGPTPLLPLETAGAGAGAGEGKGGGGGGGGGMEESEGCGGCEGPRAGVGRAGGEVLRALAAAWPRLRALQYSAGQWQGLGQADWAVLSPAGDTWGQGEGGAQERGDSVAGGAAAPAAAAGAPAGAVGGTCCGGSTKEASEGRSTPSVEGREAKAAVAEGSQGTLQVSLLSPAAAPPACCWQALGVLSLGSSQAGGGAYDGTTPRHVVHMDELPYTLHTLSLLGARLRGPRREGAAASNAPAHAAESGSGAADGGPAQAGDVFPPGLQLLSLKWCRWRVPGVR